jgi:hypothetical protein
MENFQNWSEVFVASFHKLWLDLVAILPQVIMGIVLIVVGWLVAKIVRWVVTKFLRLVALDKGLEKIKIREYMEKINLKMAPSRILAQLAYYSVMLIFFVGAAEVFGWKVVSEKIADIIAYIPRLIAGMVILAVGLYIAGWVRTGIRTAGKSFGIPSARILSNVAFFVLVIIITLTSLEQIGVNIDLIKANIFILIGGIVLAFGIGYGLGSKDMVANLLAAFYSRKKFHTGQRIRVGDVEGDLESVDSTSVSIRTSEGVVNIPAAKFAAMDVLMLNEADPV